MSQSVNGLKQSELESLRTGSLKNRRFLLKSRPEARIDANTFEI